MGKLGKVKITKISEDDNLITGEVAFGKTKGREKTNAPDWQRGNSAESIYERTQAGRQVKLGLL